MAWRTSLPEGWKPSEKVGGTKPPRQDSGAALDARRGPGASVPIGPEPIGSQPAPQGRTTDAEPSRGFGQFAVRHLERVENGVALALGQRRAVSAVRQEHDFTELERALLQRSRPASERNQPLAQVLAPMRRAVPEGVEGAPRPLVRIQHPAVGVEDKHTLAECFHHGLPERGEAQRGWEIGVLFSRNHTFLHNQVCRSKFQSGPPQTRPAEPPKVTAGGRGSQRRRPRLPPRFRRSRSPRDRPLSWRRRSSSESDRTASRLPRRTVNRTGRSNGGRSRGWRRRAWPSLRRSRTTAIPCSTS